MSDNSANRFGKYELHSRLAVGGMAEIFKARFEPAPGVSKLVVIKRILPNFAANQGFVTMFTNEAKIAIGLSHGNIAQVFDFGEIDGDWYLAMELVDGQPLSKVMKRARQAGLATMPTPLAVMVTIEMLKGLHYAHTRLDEQGRPLKIVHRDVSPQNVLVGYEGQVKLVDFGIAKARMAGMQETEAGAVKGKYAYFAPEQARGKELDARTDVFAAGIVLYELVCGQLPFQGKMIEVLGKIVRAEFPPPRAVNPDVTPALERIILTAMAPEKEQRFQTAEAFQQALSSYLYLNAPTFASARLAQFMAYLFEDELVAEGRPQHIPKDFAEQLSGWRRALPPPPVEPPHETIVARPTGRISKPSLEAPRTSERVRVPKKRGPSAWLLLVPLVAMMLTLIGVVTFGRLSSFGVQLTSTPTGAEVRVDGVPRGVTPLALDGLSVETPHRLEVRMLGLTAWEQTVYPKRGEVLALHAVLEPERPPESLPSPEGGHDAGVRLEPPAPTELALPLPPGTRVEPRTHFFPVPATNAARLRLEPERSYRVWAEGRALLGPGHDTTECAYFLELGANGRAADAFGVVGAKPLTLTGASALYAFFGDLTPNDNGGALKLRVQDVATKATRTLLVDAKASAAAPEPSQRLWVKGLSPGGSYQLVVRDSQSPAFTLGPEGGPVGQVLVGSQAPGAEALRVVPVGKPVTVRNSAWVWLAFPDDSVNDNQGALELELAPTAPKRPVAPRRNLLLKN